MAGPHLDFEAALAATLRAGGHRLTSQRLILFRALRSGGHHTADELLGAVRADLPGLSLPTVYATLDLLVELGMVRQLDVGARATVYEVAGEPHSHAVCRKCGDLLDMPLDLIPERLAESARAIGFRPESTSLLVRGLCARCGGGESTAEDA